MVLFFLASLSCSAAVALLASQLFIPLRTAVRQLPLSRAVNDHVVWLILKVFNETLNMSFEAFLASLGAHVELEFTMPLGSRWSHADHVPRPAKLWLHLNDVDAGLCSASEDLSIWDLSLLPNTLTSRS